MEKELFAIINHLEKIDCERCGKFICRASVGDIEGNYFFCEDCYKEVGNKLLEVIKETTQK